MQRQNPTKDDTTKDLTPQQAAAVDLLAMGRTVTETAEAVGASRQTVSAWLHHGTEFRAQLGLRRGELWNTATDRLRGLLPKALDVLEHELDAASLGAATALLRAAGLQGLGAPSDPRTVEDVELADRRVASARVLERMVTG